jgi:hypothetical protein
MTLLLVEGHFFEGHMKRKPTDVEIRGIANSMQIEGFPSTYASVKKSLEELHGVLSENGQNRTLSLLARGRNGSPHETEYKAR